MVIFRPIADPIQTSYLLAAHQDNTLTLFLVKSTSTGLQLTPGQRLWGHTSAVSGAHVGNRGRAVSISSKGCELRVWELEGGILGYRRGARQRSIKVSSSSTQFTGSSTAAPIPDNSNLGGHTARDMWIGFDEEKVIVHREKETGDQVLVVYDFT